MLPEVALPRPEDDEEGWLMVPVPGNDDAEIVGKVVDEHEFLLIPNESNLKPLPLFKPITDTLPLNVPLAVDADEP